MPRSAAFSATFSSVHPCEAFRLAMVDRKSDGLLYGEALFELDIVLHLTSLAVCFRHSSHFGVIKDSDQRVPGKAVRGVAYKAAYRVGILSRGSLDHDSITDSAAKDILCVLVEQCLGTVLRKTAFRQHIFPKIRSFYLRKDVRYRTFHIHHIQSMELVC